MSYIYPKELISEIKKKWEKSGFSGQIIPNLPKDEVLESLLETCYHASFLTEEQRGLAFRVIFCGKEELKNYYSEEGFFSPIRIIELQNTREFSIGELMRLAPATDFKKVLIGVELLKSKAKKPKLVIWGLVETGSSWWKFIHGESSGGMPPPNYLTISSNRPGFISISRQGNVIATLNAGKVSSPIHGVLYNGPIGQALKSSSDAIYESVCSNLEIDQFDPEGHDNEYPKRKYIQFFERILFHIRELNHGGVLIVVPDYLQVDDPRITDRLTVKYPIHYDETWNLTVQSLVLHRRYYSLHFPMWDGVADTNAQSYSQVSFLNSMMGNVDDALSDSIKLIASLSGVDGAVLITDKLRVLGFGCEVIAQSLSLKEARISSKARVTGEGRVAIENYGTRHRSTFRFCSSFEDAFAFIVSQDGGTKAVKRVGADLVLWPDINIGVF